MGVPAAGKPGEFMAIAINRFTGVELAETWRIFDMAGLFNQIGVCTSASTASEDERRSEK